VRWLISAGDAVKPGQSMLEVLTDKATMEVPAPFAGTVTKLLVEAGDKLTIGQAILDYEEKGASTKAPLKTDNSKKSSPASSSVSPKAEAHSPDGKNGAVKAAPSVRLMARKLGIDLAHVRGSGPAGRILVDDLAQQIATTSTPEAPPTEVQSGKHIKFAGLRRKIAEQMVRSKHTIPHYTYVDECDVTELVKLREAHKEAFAQKGAKLTYLAFLVKAAAAALQEVPIVNASLHEKEGEIVLHDHFNIGIAVATPGGLIVPVVRDVDQKSLFEVAKEIERLSNDARQGKTHLDDLRGGTFSVTSIGNLGGLFATPIILHPQVGILGVGKIVKRPVFDDKGQIKAADMLYLSLSFDHRVIDGAVGTQFGNAIIKRLQNPAAMLG
jgi:pyruvate dehydrogenase E2 component (dihydrolipoamide acetyltransferase)/2-oxoisovalerate dehydrogenase E2 component (dihydrolipoyl transacylase)